MLVIAVTLKFEFLKLLLLDINPILFRFSDLLVLKVYFVNYIRPRTLFTINTLSLAATKPTIELR